MVRWKCHKCEKWNELNIICGQCDQPSRMSVYPVIQRPQWKRRNEFMLLEESVVQNPPRISAEDYSQRNNVATSNVSPSTTSAATSSDPVEIYGETSRIDLISKKIDENEATEKRERILRNFEENGIIYTDPDFPPENKSLYFPNSEYSDNAIVQWRRPPEIRCYRDAISLDWVVFRGSSAADIEQGILGNCWFLSALAVVAERPELIDQILITKEYQPCGMYQVRLCHGGQWVTVTVDDNFPCDEHGNLLYSQARRKQLWIPLIEKAAAKLHGCYEALIAGHSVESLNMLTGASCETHVIGDLDRDLLWAQLSSCHQERFLMGASSGAAARDGEPRDHEYSQMGLKKKHAYSILDVQEVCGNLLLKLKNPWARTTWKGDWCNGSVLWSTIPPYEREAMGAINSNEEGVFWMCLEDFKRYFTLLDICRLRSGDWSEVRLPSHLPSLRLFNGNTIATSVKINIITVTRTTEVELVLQQAPVRHSLNLSLVDLGLLIFRGNICKADIPVLVDNSRRTIRLVTSLHKILEPGIYSIVRYSFASWHSSSPPIDSVVTIHSRDFIECIEEPLSENILRQAIISLVIKKGDEHSGRKGMTAYYLTKGWCGMFLVVENRSENMYLHVECDCNDSQNVVSSRGDLRTRDSIPPLHCQLIIVLTQLEIYQRFTVAHRLQHRNSFSPSLQDWGGPQKHCPEITNILHEPASL